MKGKLYLVATPIGNLEDITLRALKVLKEVDLIAAEDTRHTLGLLNHFEISKPLISYYKETEKTKTPILVEKLLNGTNIALVSDAGTPLICDPGSIIVNELRKHGYSLTALPGANALITFLSQISRLDESFSFAGFLPKTEQKIQEIALQYKYQDFVFYESPNRIIKTLEYIKKVRPDARAAAGRELTKIFEEIVTGTIDEVILHLKTNITKGEFVCLIFRDSKNEELSNMDDKIKLLQNKGFSAKDISVILSELYEVNKNKIYNRTVNK